MYPFGKSILTLAEVPNHLNIMLDWVTSINKAFLTRSNTHDIILISTWMQKSQILPIFSFPQWVLLRTLRIWILPGERVEPSLMADFSGEVINGYRHNLCIIPMVYILAKVKDIL